MQTLNLYGFYYLVNIISFVMKYKPCQDKLNNPLKLGWEYDIGHNIACIENQLSVSVVTSNTNHFSQSYIQTENHCLVTSSYILLSFLSIYCKWPLSYIMYVISVLSKTIVLVLIFLYNMIEMLRKTYSELQIYLFLL